MNFHQSLQNQKILNLNYDKFLKILTEPQFEQQIIKVLEVFDITQNLWAQSRSPYGIKDNKDFTDLLIEKSREYFIQNQVPIIEKDSETIYEGAILTIKSKNGRWFGFIKRGYQYENVYFDSRAYKGDVSKLLPHTKVKFEIENDKRSSFATKVELID